MSDNFDKIGIIYIDDNPTKLMSIHEKANVNLPTLDSEYSPFFDLKWFASCEEVREYRDSIRLIGYKSPTLLAEKKLIGELLFFDYAMTGKTVPVKKRYRENNPYYEMVINSLSLLPKLTKIREDLDISLDPNQTDMPGWDGDTDDDDRGCFAGALLFSLLADYPWAPVATTRKNQNNLGPEARFFEWMLESDANHAFDNKGRPALSWKELINEGVQTFRKRMEELATAGIIYLNLYDLLKLAEPEYPLPEPEASTTEPEVRTTKPETSTTEPEANATEPEEPTLTFHSRYGKKTLPINGLFIDIPENERTDKVKKWAKKLLEKLLGCDTEDINKGVEFVVDFTNLPLEKKLNLLSEIEINLDDIRELATNILEALEENNEIGNAFTDKLFKVFSKMSQKELRDLISKIVQGLEEYPSKSKRSKQQALENAKAWTKNILLELNKGIKKDMAYVDKLFNAFSNRSRKDNNALLSDIAKSLKQYCLNIDDIKKWAKKVFVELNMDIMNDDIAFANSLVDAFTNLPPETQRELLSYERLSEVKNALGELDEEDCDPDKDTSREWAGEILKALKKDNNFETFLNLPREKQQNLLSDIAKGLKEHCLNGYFYEELIKKARGWAENALEILKEHNDKGQELTNNLFKVFSKMSQKELRDLISKIVQGLEEYPSKPESDKQQALENAKAWTKNILLELNKGIKKDMAYADKLFNAYSNRSEKEKSDLLSDIENGVHQYRRYLDDINLDDIRELATNILEALEENNEIGNAFTDKLFKVFSKMSQKELRDLLSKIVQGLEEYLSKSKSSKQQEKAALKNANEWIKNILLNLNNDMKNDMAYVDKLFNVYSNRSRKDNNALLSDIAKSLKQYCLNIDDIKKWAKSILAKLLDNNGFHKTKIEDIEKGREFADKLFESFTNVPLRVQRQSLSVAVNGLKEQWLNKPQEDSAGLEILKERAEKIFNILLPNLKNEDIEKNMEVVVMFFNAYSKLSLNKQKVFLSNVKKRLDNSEWIKSAMKPVAKMLNMLYGRRNLEKSMDLDLEKSMDYFENLFKAYLDLPQNEQKEILLYLRKTLKSELLVNVSRIYYFKLSLNKKRVFLSNVKNILENHDRKSLNKSKEQTISMLNKLDVPNGIEVKEVLIYFKEFINVFSVLTQEEQLSIKEQLKVDSAVNVDNIKLNKDSNDDLKKLVNSTYLKNLITIITKLKMNSADNVVNQIRNKYSYLNLEKQCELLYNLIISLEEQPLNEKNCTDPEKLFTKILKQLGIQNKDLSNGVEFVNNLYNVFIEKSQEEQNYILDSLKEELDELNNKCGFLSENVKDAIAYIGAINAYIGAINDISYKNLTLNDLDVFVKKYNIDWQPEGNVILKKYMREYLNSELLSELLKELSNEISKVVNKNLKADILATLQNNEFQDFLSTLEHVSKESVENDLNILIEGKDGKNGLKKELNADLRNDLKGELLNNLKETCPEIFSGNKPSTDSQSDSDDSSTDSQSNSDNSNNARLFNKIARTIDVPNLKEKYKDILENEIKIIEILTEKIKTITKQFEHFFADINEADADCMKYWMDIRKKEYSSIQKRWAILFVIVKLFKFRWDAAQVCTDENQKKEINSKITYKDVYEVTYPLPEDHIILPKDPSSTWTQASNLKNLEKCDLALLFSDILESKNWTRPGKNQVKGFMKGERTILIMYANCLGDWKWEEIPGLKKMLMPKTK